jgi:4-hydroxy-3-methylbut-2-enyl diphosphate reductase
MQVNMLDVQASEAPPSASGGAVPGVAALPRLRVWLAAPRGFCAGVRRAIQAVEDALEVHGAPVYVRRAIVHNLAVVRALEAKGAVFVQELDEVPDHAVVIFSAHGVPPSVAAEAKRRKQLPYDAVCPLVEKVHREVTRHYKAGRHVVLIGHRSHPEIVGTLGRLPAGAASLIQTADDVEDLEIDAGSPVGYAVQTTFSVEEASGAIAGLRARFSDLAEPPSSHICYATTNRQAAIRSIAPQADAIIVAGEDFSSNACRLAEVAKAAGCPSVQLVAEAAQLDWDRLPKGGIVGITAAASTPEESVAGIVRALQSRFDVAVEEVEHAEETTAFKPLAIA